jgi:hypothetical protein
MSLDTTKWRTHPQRANGYLYIHKPDVVWETTIDQTTFSYPIVSIAHSGTISGDRSNAGADQTIKVSSSGGIFKGYIRARFAPNASTVSINATSQADIDFANGDVLEFLSEYRLWTRIPRIEDDGTIKKDYTITYPGYTSEPPPVPNAGGYYAQFVDGSGKITVDFDASSSFTMTGNSISYFWDFEDGTPGTSNSATVNGVSFPAGARWVRLQVEDLGSGRSINARTLVVGIDNSTVSAIPAQLLSHTQTVADGNNVQFGVASGDIGRITDIPDGAIVIYFEDEHYGENNESLTGESGREHVKFIGYIDAVKTGIQANQAEDVILECIGPLGALKRLPAYPQVLEYVDTSTSWLEYDIALNWWLFTHYLLYWHSTFINIFDIERPSHYNQYPVVRLESVGGTLYDQMQDIAKAVGGNVTANRNGRLLFRKWPVMLSSADRAALTPSVQLTTDDWFGQIAINERHSNKTGWLRSSAIVASNTAIVPVLAIAPGAAPGQGRDQQTLTRQLVASQAELNQRTGAYYAYLNRNIQNLRVNVLNRGNVADAANQDFIQLFADSASNRRGLQFGSSDYFVVTQVDISQDPLTGVGAEVWTLEPIPAYVDGVTIDIPSDGTDYNSQPPPSWVPIPFEDVAEPDFVDDDIPTGTTGIALAWNNPLAYTATREAPGWSSIWAPGTGFDAVRSVVGDEYTSFYQTGAGAAGAYGLTGTNLYYCPDVTAGSPAFTNKQALLSYNLLRLPRGVNGGIMAYGGGTSFIISNTFDLVDEWSFNSTTAAETDGSFATDANKSYRVKVRGDWLYDSPSRADGQYNSLLGDFTDASRSNNISINSTANAADNTTYNAAEEEFIYYIKNSAGNWTEVNILQGVDSGDYYVKSDKTQATIEIIIFLMKESTVREVAFDYWFDNPASLLCATGINYQINNQTVAGANISRWANEDINICSLDENEWYSVTEADTGPDTNVGRVRLYIALKAPTTSSGAIRLKNISITTDTDTHVYEWTRSGNGDVFGVGVVDATTYVDNVGYGYVELYEITSTLFEAGNLLAYSSDRGDTIGTQKFGSGLTSTGGMDCDDFNLGIAACVGGTAGITTLYYTTSYDGSVLPISGVQPSGLLGTSEYNLVRIPYRIFNGKTRNDDPLALNILWGANAAVLDETLWYGRLNTASGTMSNITAITPAIGTVTYRVADGNSEQAEVNGFSPAVMAGMFTPVNGSGNYLLTTTDTGQNWTSHGTYDYNFLRWGASGNKTFWLAGSAGLGYSPDRGVTVEDRTGDYISVGTPSAARGVFTIG